MLESPDPDLIRNLAQERGIRACFDRTLSPRAVTIIEDQLPTLLRRLAWRDITPNIQGSLGTPNKSSAGTKNGAAEFDQATLAHLYLSAKLCHLLPDVLPIPYRLPFAVLTEIEQQLSPHDRALAQTIINRTLTDLARQQSQISAANHTHNAIINEADIQDDDWPQPPTAYVQYFAPIEQAIANGTALTITYHSPEHDGLTQRTIEPLRLEQSGPRTYLIAHCQLAQAQRTFRLDRIRSLRE